MSWRRFAVLVGGLSAQSLWHLHHAARARERRDVHRLEDPKAIEDWFANLATKPRTRG